MFIQENLIKCSGTHTHALANTCRQESRRGNENKNFGGNKHSIMRWYYHQRIFNIGKVVKE